MTQMPRIKIYYILLKTTFVKILFFHKEKYTCLNFIRQIKAHLVKLRILLMLVGLIKSLPQNLKGKCLQFYYLFT